MEEQSTEVKKVLDFLNKKEKLVAMLAPSFPVDLDPENIVGQLKRLGFSFVVEVSRGAAETNKQLLELMKKNPRARYITSPCPTIVRLIRRKYKNLIKYLSPTFSPMAMTAKLCLKKYPDYKKVFIGPCLLKKIEAKEDYPDLDITVITYKELKEILKLKGIKGEKNDLLSTFDMVGSGARLYPISGGLAQSCGLNLSLVDDEYDVISGPQRVKEILEKFEKSKLKVLDVLNCDGGCIGGPGIDNDLPSEERRKKVIAHWTKVLR